MGITSAMAQNMSSKDNEADKLEPEGAPGQKEPEGGPEPAGSTDPDGGSWNTAAQAANAAQHGWPAIHAEPENVTGQIESAGPTKGEGASVGPVEYGTMGSSPGEAGFDSYARGNPNPRPNGY